MNYIWNKETEDFEPLSQNECALKLIELIKGIKFKDNGSDTKSKEELRAELLNDVNQYIGTQWYDEIGKELRPKIVNTLKRLGAMYPRQLAPVKKAFDEFDHVLIHSEPREYLPADYKPGLTVSELNAQVNAKAAEYEYDFHTQGVYMVKDNECVMLANGSGMSDNIAGMPIITLSCDTSGDVLHSNLSAAAFKEHKTYGGRDPDNTYVFVEMKRQAKHGDHSGSVAVCHVYADETGIYLLDRKSTPDACKPLDGGTFYTHAEADAELGGYYDEHTIKENTKVTLTLGQLRRLVKEGLTLKGAEKAHGRKSKKPTDKAGVESDEVEKYIDEWPHTRELTDSEFDDFCYFVDNYTGVKAYSAGKKKIPLGLFKKLYVKWMADWDGAAKRADMDLPHRKRR